MFQSFPSMHSYIHMTSMHFLCIFHAILSFNRYLPLKYKILELSTPFGNISCRSFCNSESLCLMHERNFFAIWYPARFYYKIAFRACVGWNVLLNIHSIEAQSLILIACVFRDRSEDWKKQVIGWLLRLLKEVLLETIVNW